MQNSGGKTALGLDANVGALICYLGNIVCALGLIYSVIVVFQDKTNKLVRFHAFQSIFLSIFPIVTILVYFVVALVGVAIDSALGIPVFSIILILVYILLLIVFLGAFVFMIIAAIKAFNGEIYKIPVLGNLADKYSN